MQMAVSFYFLVIVYCNVFLSKCKFIGQQSEQSGIMCIVENLERLKKISGNRQQPPKLLQTADGCQISLSLLPNGSRFYQLASSAFVEDGEKDSDTLFPITPDAMSRVYLLQTRSDQQDEWTDLESCYYLDPFQAVAKANELRGSLLARSRHLKRSVYRIVEYFCGSPTSSCHVIETLTNLPACQLEATLLKIPVYEDLELAAA